MNEKKKIMFVYLKTGGGHLAPARALAKYINAASGQKAETNLIDGLERSSAFSKLIVEDGYRFLQSKAKWLYELIYLVHKFKLIAWISSFLVSLNTKKYLAEIIEKENPETIVILHFFLIHPVNKILKQQNRKVKTVSVVTDPFTPHPLWFLNKKQSFIVFSDELKNHCLKIGISREDITVLPFVVDEKYSTQTNYQQRQELKAKFGFTNQKVVLIMGGGDGMPNGEKIARGLLKLNGKIEIAFVAGKNKELFNNISKLKTKNNLDQLKLFSFVDYIYELISLSDIIVTKCGASTLMEILLSQKVPVVNRYLWEQEKGNVDYLVRNKMGVFEQRTDKLIEEVERLVDDKDYYDEYIDNITKQKIINGVEKVAEHILSL